MGRYPYRRRSPAYRGFRAGARSGCLIQVLSILGIIGIAISFLVIII